MRILLVDNRIDQLTELARILTEFDYQVTMLHNPDFLLSLSRNQNEISKYNLIILNFEMGNRSGQEYLMELNRRKHNLSIIILTGYKAGFDKNAAKNGQPYTWLEKPFDINKLIQHIEKIKSELSNAK